MSMASDELSDRIRQALQPGLGITEQKMFGGRCFMLHGNMLVCPLKSGGLMVRVGKDGQTEALSRVGTSPVTMRGRTMSGFIEVSGDTLEDDDALADWIGFARSFVQTLPPK